MDNKLLLVKCVTLLYRQSLLATKGDDSVDLVRTAIESIKLPDIAVGINSAFPMKNNPFFQPEESETDFWQLLLSNVYSAELVQFCLDTCKNNLPFLRKKVWKTYLKDIDFLLRFLKVDSYHSKPEITFL